MSHDTQDQPYDAETQHDNTQHEAVETSPLADASLDTVRDILFGQQSRAIDHKLKALEGSLQNTTNQLYTELSLNIQNLNKHVQTGLQTEREERELSDNILQDNVDKQVSDLDSRTNSNLKELQGELHYQSDALNQRLEQLNQSLNATNERISQLHAQLQATDQQLQQQKLDRHTLADLLAMVADQLRNV